MSTRIMTLEAIASPFDLALTEDQRGKLPVISYDPNALVIVRMKLDLPRMVTLESADATTDFSIGHVGRRIPICCHRAEYDLNVGPRIICLQLPGMTPKMKYSAMNRHMSKQCHCSCDPVLVSAV